MTWTAPFTAVANTPLTASQWNSGVRDNFNETAPAKATTAGRIFVSTGVNSIAERDIPDATVSASQTTASTSYTDLGTIGPQITVTTGVKAIAFWTANVTNTTADEATLMSVTVSGATSISASDAVSLHLRGPVSPATQSAGKFKSYTLNAWSNTFTCKYRVPAGTGSWGERYLLIIAL